MCTSGKCVGWCPSHYMLYCTNEPDITIFLSKLLQWNSKHQLTEEMPLSVRVVCSFKNKGYTEWKTGPRFRHQTASMGRYEMATILFSDIESYWKLKILLGTLHAILLHNMSSISYSLKIFSYIHIYIYSIGLCSGHQCAHLGNVQAGAQATLCYTT